MSSETGKLAIGENSPSFGRGGTVRGRSASRGDGVVATNLNAPNTITVIRIILMPLFLYLELSGLQVAGFGLFVLLTGTDKLDGFIARKYNLITPLGELLDPIADKLLVFSGLFVVCLELQSPIITVCSVIVVIREVGITVYRLIVARTDVKVIPADKFGKLKTVLQFVTLIYMLFPITAIVIPIVYLPLVLLFTIITLYSGIKILISNK
jgi:CDP-diacylglycerol--glycerol-3-phosphate 3-phosphatidyltransferase